MTKKFRTAINWLRSDNPKSTIQKRRRRSKWVELVSIVIAFVGLADGVESQQPKKVYRIGYFSISNPPPTRLVERIPTRPARTRLHRGNKFRH